MAKLAEDIEDQIDRALAEARDFNNDEVAAAVKYVSAEDLFLLTLQSGRRVAIPREDLQDVADMTTAEASRVSLADLGTVVEWQEQKVDFRVKRLADGCWGNKKWMAHLSERRRKLLKRAS